MQIVTKLLNNAAKYTPEGGVVTLTVRNDTHYAFLEVQGDGIGIDASLLPSIFALFRQAQRTPDRSQGGLGIGFASSCYTVARSRPPATDREPAPDS